MEPVHCDCLRRHHWRLAGSAAGAIQPVFSRARHGLWLCLQRSLAVLLLGWLLLVLSASASAEADDWPCWGYDSSRQGASPVALSLPKPLSLLWRRELPPPKRAWLEQKDDGDKLEFDLSYSPVVAGKKLYLSSMTDDCLTAYDTDTGKEHWRFFADGPMRLAPTVWAGKVYAVSDDGRLYCLDADNGKLLWSYQGAPGAHLVLGNRRVISLWPARGAALVADGTVFFASGVWPFLGTCVYALDAETGRVRWANTGHSTQWQAQPHGGAFAFSGLAPQGYLALAGDKLVVAGGRSLPALFDRHSGALLYYNAQAKPAGGYRVMTDEKYYYNHGLRYALADGKAAGKAELENDSVDALRSQVQTLREQLDSEVFESIAADDKLFISTHHGTLYCFGQATDAAPKLHVWQPQPLAEPSGAGALQARQLLEQLAVKSGWALIPGGADTDFLDALLLHSELNLVVLEADPELRLQLRQRFSATGQHGERIAFLPGTLRQLRYPEYITSLLLVPNPERAGLRAESADLHCVYQLLRPYSGRAWLNFAPKAVRPSVAQGLRHRLYSWFGQTKLPASAARFLDFTPLDGTLEVHPDGIVLARTTGLPGAGQWTHQHANAAQSVISEDQLVRPPFAPIWFGTTSNNGILPRHHHGPRPQVAGGVLAILGVETLSARCVYTGRDLWVKDFPGIGHAFTSMELEEKWRAGESVYMINDPGATYIGSPFVTMADSIYVRYQGSVYRLRPEDGLLLGQWPLFAQTVETETEDMPDWGHISVQGDCLIATSNPYIFMEGKLGKLSNGWDGSASRRLIVMNRFTGEVLWHRDAAIGFRHNAICSSGQHLFVNDLLSASALDLALRRGLPISQRPRLYALDLSTGHELWSVESDVFGTFLSYSSAHDILLEGGTRDGRRHLADEPSDRLLARRGRDGTVLWQRQESYSGPLIIHDDMIISGRPGAGLCLFTGLEKTRIHPLTGAEIPWRYWKSYGCGSSNASTHLLLFRSGAAGFADLEHDGGTGNLGGFKSGCTASMIAADGILNAPDYTRTCTCSYQNQTSLGLVHRPEMELWTSNQPMQKIDGQIQQVGINLGAPGDRRSDNGTLWLHTPRLAPSPELTVLLECGNQPDGVRVIAALGPSDHGQPEDSLDERLDTGWSVYDKRTGVFSASDALELTLSEPVALSEWRMAWKAPAETTFELQLKNESEWETVFSGQGGNAGQKSVSYTFPVQSSSSWRVVFGSHADESKDSSKRRINQSVTVYEVRLGDLDMSTYAYFSPKTFWQTHSLLADAPDGLRWVVSSGVKDIRRLLLPASFDPNTTYELRLFFAEPELSEVGARVFDVLVQGHEISRGFDPYALAGGLNRGQTLVCRGLKLQNRLQVEFRPQSASRYGAVLCGLELRREK